MFQTHISHPRNIRELKKPLCVCVCFCVVQQPKSFLGRLTVEVSTSHTIKHTHTHTNTHTHGRTPLNEQSARRSGRYLHNAQQTQ
jgi:hypothetical protein